MRRRWASVLTGLALSGATVAILLTDPGPSWASSVTTLPSQKKEELLTLPEGGMRLLLLPRNTPVRTLEYQGRSIRLFSWIEGGKERSKSVRAGIVGVDFARPPGPVSLVFHSVGRSGQRVLLVRARPFQVSRLHVARSFVTPPQSLLRRLARERKAIHRALDPPDEPLRFHRPFILPLSGKTTHDFGAYRYLNGRAMARHSGEDIDAPYGTPVRAANDGIVRLAGSFFYDGNMVIINHGGGLLTEYLHMSDILVHEGEAVLRGAVIGHVGHTGRVTGPVLHYGAVLQGNHVNPMLLPGLMDQALHLSSASLGRVGR